MSERDLQRSIVHAARELGWHDAWTWKSFHSPKGWPDLFLARGLHLIVAELKSDKSKVTPEQEMWLAWWREFGAAVALLRGRLHSAEVLADFQRDAEATLRAQDARTDQPEWTQPKVSVFVWRPADLDEAYRILATGRAA